MINKMYHPITATPFRSTDVYQEIPPCHALHSYIRCFWGSEQPYLKNSKNIATVIVVPDTCVDIMYNIDYTQNEITGGFCGVNDKSFVSCDKSRDGHFVSTFCIRFYAWGAYAFAEDSFTGTTNGFYDISSRFQWLDKQLRARLFETTSLAERICLVESLFLKRMSQIKEHNIVNGAVQNIILNQGTLGITQLVKDSFISSRQLERLFHEYIGITPKKLSNLVRYQSLWNDILSHPQFDISDAVYQHGFTDQSHLMREFKRYHTMDIQKAKRYAYHNVENIQDFICGF
jgi:AraC-like DNA-binding protein